MSSNTGVNEALLDALPDARRILELGCATGALGQRYKASHPASYWLGVDINAEDVAVARTVLDEARSLDVEADSLDQLGGDFDLVVLGDVLEHLRAPERVLQKLHAVCASDSRLACCMPNLSHVSVLERMLSGDVMYDDHGLLDRTHLRIFAPRSMFKMMLDAAWLPNAVSRYRAEHRSAEFTHHLAQAASHIGIAPDAARDILETYQLIIVARRAEPSGASSPALRVAGVTPVMYLAQVELNFHRSPGLSEIGAAILPLRGANSTVAVFDFAKANTEADWFFVMREDAYLPVGSGHALARQLALIAPETARRTAYVCRPVVAGTTLLDGAVADFGEEPLVAMHRSFEGSSDARQALEAPVYIANYRTGVR